MKGFKDSSGKFHPITEYKGVRKSRDQSAKTQGVKIRKARSEPSNIFLTFMKENPKFSAVSGYDKLKDHPKVFRAGAGSFTQALWDGDIEEAIHRADHINKKALEKILFERKARDKKTEDQSYWGSNGKYQKEADILQDLVPSEGASQFTDIELYRVASNVYYDIMNNGGGNLAEGNARNDEYKFLEAQFDMPIITEMLEAMEMRDYPHEDETVGDAEALFDQATEEMDIVMDSVIEKIMKMPNNHLGFQGIREIKN